jgi:hypothetical protein
MFDRGTTTAYQEPTSIVVDREEYEELKNNQLSRAEREALKKMAAEHESKIKKEEEKKEAKRRKVIKKGLGTKPDNIHMFFTSVFLFGWLIPVILGMLYIDHESNIFLLGFSVSIVWYFISFFCLIYYDKYVDIWYDIQTIAHRYISSINDIDVKTVKQIKKIAKIAYKNKKIKDIIEGND